MHKWAVFFIFFLVSGCLSPRVQITPVRADRQSPPAWLFAGIESDKKITTARYLGKFKLTFYWVVEENDYPQRKVVPLYSVDGKLVGKFCPSFVKDFKVESAARLRNGLCLSYLKKQNRVQVVDRFLGHGGYKLSELKSIAVDPSIIPLGSKVYIPQFEGVTVNNQQLSGVFYAHDIGSAVKGRHIDLFLGDRDYMKILASAGIVSSGSIDVYLLE